MTNEDLDRLITPQKNVQKNMSNRERSTHHTPAANQFRTRQGRSPVTNDYRKENSRHQLPNQSSDAGCLANVMNFINNRTSPNFSDFSDNRYSNTQYHNQTFFHSDVHHSVV